ncbi:MAG: NifB/NifX family molybdenum-iron cluster-binding protein [Parachlamydiales bacterium]|nr:NifB/NifX family molybdenum-iron cluster-binding protein [Parachlamydiales bacterium]
MRIFVPTEGEDINNKVNVHFCKSKYFILMDTDIDTWEIVENTFLNNNAEKNVPLKVISLNVHSIIVKNIGPICFETLKKAGIKVYKAENETAKEAIDKLKKDELIKIKKPNKKDSKIFKET